MKGAGWGAGSEKSHKEFVLKLGEEPYYDMEEEIAKVQFSSILELFNTTWVLGGFRSVAWSCTIGS